MIKRFVSLLTAASVCAASLCGCVNNKKNTFDVDIAEDGNVTAPGQLPVVKRRITLTCAAQKLDTVIDYNTNAFTKWLEKQTGINLEFVTFDDLAKDIKVMLESDEKLPDIIFTGALGEIDLLRYGVNGTQSIRDLGEYMDKYGYWLNDIYTKSSITNIEKYLYSTDGCRYYMPTIVEQTGNNYGMKTWINKTWLDKLGLDIPKTTDEFKAVMKAFVTQDPNGNGKADELGITGNAEGWCANPARFLINSFIFEGDPLICQYADVGDDGQLYLNFMQPEYKDAMNYISDLAKSKLFDTAAFTRSGDEMLKMAAQEENVIGCFTGGSPERVFANKKERMMEYTALPPLEGPRGVSYAYTTPSQVDVGACITKSCKYPFAAFRLLDYMMSQDATIRKRYGVEGKNWSYATDDDICIFESIGCKAVIKSNFQFGTEQNVVWEVTGPEFRYPEIANGMAWNGDPTDGEKFKADALNVYINKGPEKIVEKFSFTEDEYEQVAAMKNKIIPFAENRIRRFCTGEDDVNSGWDDFQNELKQRGADRFLALLQSGYERFEEGAWK